MVDLLDLIMRVVTFVSFLAIFSILAKDTPKGFSQMVLVAVLVGVSATIGVIVEVGTEFALVLGVLISTRFSFKQLGVESWKLLGRL